MIWTLPLCPLTVSPGLDACEAAVPDWLPVALALLVPTAPLPPDPLLLWDWLDAGAVEEVVWAHAEPCRNSSAATAANAAKSP
jgi:hypothetical protein